MDEVPDISKSQGSLGEQEECNDCRRAFLQISIVAMNFPFHIHKTLFNDTFWSGGLPTEDSPSNITNETVFYQLDVFLSE